MASAGSGAFGRRGGEMNTRRLERLARASSRGIALAQQALASSQQTQQALDALTDASGNIIGGTGALGPLTVVGRGADYGTIPVGGFKQGSLVTGLFGEEDVSYICFGSISALGQPLPSLLVVLLTGVPDFGDEGPPPLSSPRVVIPLFEFFGDSGPQVSHAVVTLDGQFVVPTPAEAFGIGETLAFPYLERAGSLRVAQTETPLAFALPANTYVGRGVVGLDGAVYFLPSGGRPILRLDPATGSLSFLPLPEDAGEASFHNGALHPASGHIIAAPASGSAGRVLAIPTAPSASPSPAFWIQGSTRVFADFSFFGDEVAPWSEITDPEGVLRLTDAGASETDEGVSSGVAYNLASHLFVFAPGPGVGDTFILRYEPGGSSEVRRFPLRTEPRGIYFSGPYTNAIYNPARGTVVLLPADALRLLEIDYAWPEDESARLPTESVLFNFAFPFGPKIFGAVVHAGRLLCFPFQGPSSRVLDLDAARDPDADNLVSFYGY
jgi:hypothetical protein